MPIPAGGYSGVYLEVYEAMELVQMLRDAAEALRDGTRGAQQTDLPDDLVQYAGLLTQGIGNLAHLTSPGIAKAGLGEAALKLEPPPAHFQRGYRLGQSVEVRYVVDDEERWEVVTVARGSGGGMYSVEFVDGEVWDGIPSTDLRLPAAPATPAAAAAPPTQWNLAAPASRLMFSGWCTAADLKTWRKSPAAKWAMLIGTTLYTWRSPLTDKWDSYSLAGVCVESNGDARTISLRNHDEAYAVELALGCVYEWRVWHAQLAAAALRAAGVTERAEFDDAEASLRGMLLRPLLPVLTPGELAEDQMPATLHGYIVVADSHTFLTGHNWGRRYVTLHRHCVVVRPEKKSAAGSVVLPLREAACWKHPIKERSAVDTFEISGPFISKTLFCFDTTSEYDRWHAAVCAAVFASNPEDALTEKLKLQADEGAGRGAT
eukprot:TRINITY_DN13184_c0_g1_i1.p1 TRINITY_DN13184_c0_g1~~TRINITY_DN13184_c0_g1_i1.p1  ORF type:complete len:501 (+),score=143.73 TRINITY_DN13184_c0_g1_i1:208-1503(+)